MISPAPYATRRAEVSFCADEIETERLRLRMFTLDDLRPLSLMTKDPEVMKYIGTGKPITTEETRFSLAKIVETFRRRGFGRWAVIHKEANELIGYCGFAMLEEKAGVELAYLLGRPFWGKGLATEAARACLRYGFDELHFDCIAAITRPENKRSQRVMEKVGMRYLRRAPHCHIECVHYAISKEEFVFTGEPYTLRRSLSHSLGAHPVAQ
ncbi:MAG: GNAT family N-acetyltransferase [Acidobacteriota bacterium]|nr:GNAT family N-acetyltransferase [Acidobacteriota bacterium]